MVAIAMAPHRRREARCLDNISIGEQEVDACGIRFVGAGLCTKQSRQHSALIRFVQDHGSGQMFMVC